MFAVDDFENVDFHRTDRLFGYRDWTLSYIWHWGKKLMSSFRDRLKKAYEYFTPWELEELEVS